MKKNEKINKKVVSINGWVSSIRKLGKITFLIIQQSDGDNIQAVVKDPEKTKIINNVVKNGDLINIEGFFEKKIKSQENSESEELEVLINNWKIINKSSNLPFEIKEGGEYKTLKEHTKYKYRYIDLRRKKSKFPIIMKSKFQKFVRSFFNSKKFIEIDTPILSQFSPEGAKTFAVQSNFENRFYTLPQSPQIYKQILMMSGFSKYYQIAKNFRNEDARSNRQIEFLQLDVEMWFAKEATIFNLSKSLLKKFLTKELKIPEKKIEFKKISFEKCMSIYGTEKPDLRNTLKIENLKKNTKLIFLGEKIPGFQIENFSDKIEKASEEDKEIITFIIEKSDKEIRFIKLFNSKKIEEGQIKNLISEREQGIYIVSECKKKEKLTLFLGKIRSIFDDLFKEEKKYCFLWINNWPLFEKKDQFDKYSLLRHPFTLPKEKYIKAILEKNEKIFKKIKCEAYDLVCNGEEIASASLRINKEEVQRKIFEIIGFEKEEIEDYFGYFLEALSFAAPPHGGIGMGIERMISVFLNLKSLKETIAFPKNIDGSCSLTGAPNYLKNKKNS